MIFLEDLSKTHNFVRINEKTYYNEEGTIVDDSILFARLHDSTNRT